MMGHRIIPYIGLNEIKSPSPMTNFITISYLFNYIFRFIRWYFLDLSIKIFWDYSLVFLFMFINNTLCYCFWDTWLILKT